MDFTTNYCGPYWSDGKLQSSVANGSSKPVSDLDAECQKHDAAYAKAETEKDLVAADEQFYKATQDLGIRGPIYGSAVLHGNRLARLATKFAKPNVMSALLSAIIPSKYWYSNTAARNQQKALNEAANKKNAVHPADVPDKPSGKAPTADITADQVPVAGEAVGAWQDATFVHPTAGHTTDDTEYGSIGSDNRVYGFHDYIPAYKPLKRKKEREKTPKELEKAAKLFFKEHPPITKHTKKCSTCRVLMQSPKYQQLLLLSETPSVAHKRA